MRNDKTLLSREEEQLHGLRIQTAAAASEVIIEIADKFIVENGNSLWRIARRTLGGGIHYAEIYKNNKKIIHNPDLIFPGQVFKIPNLKHTSLYE